MELSSGRRRVPTVPVVVRALAFVAALAPGIASAQEEGWALASQEVRVVIPEAGTTASVTSRFYLAPAGEEAVESGGGVTVEVLGFGAAVVRDLRRDGGADLPLRRLSGTRFGATLTPPFATDASGPFVELSYVVEQAVSGSGVDRHVRVPMISAPARPAGAEDDGSAVGGFDSVIEVPEGWRIREGFPSGLGRSRDGGRLRVGLPVTPALIAFRARTDGRWRPGFPLLIDGLTVMLLLGFAGLGWRHLQGVVSGRRPLGEPGP